MLNSKEADFILRGDGEIIYPEIAKDELELYYDVKGKKNSDVHKNKLLDMSGQGKDGELSGFGYDGELSGYDGDNGLVFDGVDDTLKTPKLSGIDVNNFTYQLNNNILTFTGDEVKTVKDGDVEVGGRNYFAVDNLTPRAPSIGSKRLYTFQVEPGELHTLKVYGNAEGASFRVDGETVRFDTAKNEYQFTSNAGGVVTIDFWRDEDLPFIDGRARAKLEKGNIATPWTPAPEDLIETTELKGNILGDMEGIVDASPRDRQSGEEVFTEHADDSHVEVEVDGKSYQDGDPTPDYPIEIHSLNDFDVVSDVGGRNYFSVSFFGSVEGTSNPFYSAETDYIYTLEPNTYYTLSTTAPPRTSSGTSYIHFDNFPLRASSNLNGVVHGSPKTILTNNEGRISITINRINNQETISRIINGDYKIRLEKGTVATDWTPAPEDITENDNHPLIDKVNISLSEPLRSVGDIKDRLFRDSDDLWKIERNVGEEVFENGEKFSDSYWYANDGSADYGITSNNADYIKERGAVNLSHLPEEGGNSIDGNVGWLETSPRLRIRLEHEVIGATEPSPSLFKEWLVNEYNKGTPLTIVYEKTESTIEPLDQELQDKLNTLKSFKGSNYIYTVQNKDNPHKEQLKPTLHATFNSKDYLKETRTVTNLLIWARELTDEELIHHNQLFLNRFNMRSDRGDGEPSSHEINLLSGGKVAHIMEQNYTIDI